MSAPSDGARADARKARAEAMGSGRIEDMICPCSFPGYTHVTAVHGQPSRPTRAPETTRLRLRMAFLATQLEGIDAAMATALSYVAMAELGRIEQESTR